ncbi:hypothetical protein D3C80_1534900 [compost metagenome]
MNYYDRGGLFFAIGGFSPLVSRVCNDEKKAIGISGCITFAFFTIDILAKITDKLNAALLHAFSFYRPGRDHARHCRCRLDFLLAAAHRAVVLRRRHSDFPAVRFAAVTEKQREQTGYACTSMYVIKAFSSPFTQRPGNAFF